MCVDGPIVARAYNLLEFHVILLQRYLVAYCWGKPCEDLERNFNSMRFTSNVAKSSAVILQMHVPSPFPTQYNVARSKELCLHGFNTVRGVGGEGRDVQC